MEPETVPKQTDVAWERQFAELQEAVREVRQEMQSLRQPSYFSNCSSNRVDRPAVPNHRQRAADPPRYRETTEHCQRPKRGSQRNRSDNFDKPTRVVVDVAVNRSAIIVEK